MNILPIEFNETVQRLLSDEGLPFEDLSTPNNVKLFGLTQSEQLIGLVGVELYGDAGLLRSLAVHKDSRSEGYGKNLVEFLESWAIENNVACFYLLTTTAQDYFLKRGYKEIARNQAPTAIADTAQFSDLCPTSATFMCKIL